MPYNVYLADRGLPGSQIPADLRQAVASDLRSWFTEILQMTNSPVGNTAAVTWVDNRPQIQPYELLIFFVQSQSYSVLQHMPRINVRNRTRSGLTGWNGAFTCSEVYIDFGTRFLSQMAFHEAMHNKTHFDNQRLHSGDGLARESLQSPGAPSANNKTLMSQHILSNKPQWLDGFRY
jgi:hypothetical protein